MTHPQFVETIIHEGANAELRLAELRLSEAGLVEVVKQGEYARNESTNHDPVTAGGFDAYRYRIRGLRDTFCRQPYGWTPGREQNLELLCSPCGRRAIITKPGDEGVGDPTAHPQPKRELGDVSAEAVAANTSLWLDPNWANVGTTTAPQRRETWILLVRRSGDIVRAELSLASGEQNGRVLAWLERILLSETDLSSPGNVLVSVDAPEEIDVPVARRR
jgi:hypothetical protein